MSDQGNDVTYDFDDLTGQLRDCRRPDIAVGLLLAADLASRLIEITPQWRDVIGTALADAAAAVYADAEDVLTELAAHPDGEYVDEDHLACDCVEGA